MIAPPLVRGGVVARSIALLVGLFLFAAGVVALLESGLGLSPWDVLNQGIADHTQLSFGTANVVVAVVVLLVAWRLGARVGPGTVANAILIGLFIDLLLRLDAVDALGDQSLGVRVALMIGGIVVVGLGSAFYIGAGMGAGPRDSLMLVVSARTGSRVGLVRAALEIAVTVVGFALGGTVGIGTLAFAFGIGPVVELCFWALDRSFLAEPSPAAAE